MSTALTATTQTRLLNQHCGAELESLCSALPYKCRTLCVETANLGGAMPGKTDRLELRMAPRHREQISAAADEVDESVSDFVRKAALDRAETVLATSRQTWMPAEQFDALIRSLDEPDEAPSLKKVADEPRRFTQA